MFELEIDKFFFCHRTNCKAMLHMSHNLMLIFFLFLVFMNAAIPIAAVLAVRIFLFTFL